MNTFDGSCDCATESELRECEQEFLANPTQIWCNQPDLFTYQGDTSGVAIDYYTGQASCDLCEESTAPQPPVPPPDSCSKTDYYDTVCSCHCENDGACSDE